MSCRPSEPYILLLLDKLIIFIMAQRWIECGAPVAVILLVIIKRQLGQRKRLHASSLSLCSSVCLTDAKIQKRDFLKN